jgi:archaellum component FlaG (FlaF/FlaG flagellin family)
MAIIKDGAGTGKTARVNTENRLDVESISRSIDQHINELYQKYFSLPFDAVDPTGADDYFFYLKNTGTKNLHITDLRIYSTVVGTVEVQSVSGTASSGTTVTPVNRTIGNSNSLDATIETGVDITGLTNEGVLFYHRLDTADEEKHLKMSAHIILPPGQAIALLWDAATGALSGSMSVYEDQGVV